VVAAVRIAIATVIATNAVTAPDIAMRRGTPHVPVSVKSVASRRAKINRRTDSANRNASDSRREHRDPRDNSPSANRVGERRGTRVATASATRTGNALRASRAQGRKRGQKSNR
jgi:hypothetical protein